MIWLTLMIAGIWFGGRMMNLPKSIRMVMMVLAYGAVVLAVWALPPDNGLRQSIGGTVQGWLVLGAFIALAAGYAGFVSAAKKRARTPNAAKRQPLFSDSELERNARHIVLREIGGPGQKKLKEAKVLVVGAGGLGSPVLLYLAAAGVGEIGIIDDDVVENSNLQRQVIHIDANNGMPKVFSAEQAMKRQNPVVKVRGYNRRLTSENAADLISEYDLVLDGTDNFDTRYLVNKTCVRAKVPLISGALTQWEGQISTFDPAHGAPCYQCVFPKPPADGLAPSCAEAGVLGPLAGVIGTLMAVEAIKEITGAGEGLRGRMMIYDALYAETRLIGVKRRPDCKTCSALG
jgi:molybdopterin/thiamine biosynthesis adenylyltransferase